MLRRICIIGVLGCLLEACSFLNFSDEYIQVATSEDDAKIYINSVYEGQGSANVKVVRDEDVSILVKKKGFRPETREISRKLSSVGFVDLLGGAIIVLPLFGLLSSGAWEPEQNNISIILEKE